MIPADVMRTKYFITPVALFGVPFLATLAFGLLVRGIKVWFSIKADLPCRINFFKCKNAFSPNPNRKSSTNGVAVRKPCVIPTYAASYPSLSASPQTTIILPVLKQTQFSQTQGINQIHSFNTTLICLGKYLTLSLDYQSVEKIIWISSW